MLAFRPAKIQRPAATRNAETKTTVSKEVCRHLAEKKWYPNADSGHPGIEMNELLYFAELLLQ